MEVSTINGWDKLTVQGRRNALMELERGCLAEEAKGNVADIEIVEHYCNGIYAREMRAPQGAFVISEIHKEANFAMLQEGTLVVLTEDGKETLTGPKLIQGKAGVKRAGLMLTDVVWISFHATEETDSTVIRNEVVVDSYEDLIMLEKQNVVGSNSGSSNASCV